MTFLALLAPALGGFMGPSVNSITNCKWMKDEGYLDDRCFDEYGSLKERHCLHKTARGSK